MKAQPLIISLVVLVTALVLATSLALDAKAGMTNSATPLR